MVAIRLAHLPVMQWMVLCGGASMAAIGILLTVGLGLYF